MRLGDDGDAGGTPSVGVSAHPERSLSCKPRLYPHRLTHRRPRAHHGADLGLAYLRFESGRRAVSVPTGARAGHLTLQPCPYETEQGSYDADCGRWSCPRTGPARTHG